MKAKSINDYIRIGTCLRFLQDANEGSDIHKEGFILENINSFLSTLEENALYVTKRASYDLVSLQAKLKGTSKGSTLNSSDAVELRKIMNRIRATFEAETEGFYAYVVTDKRIDIKKLLNNVGQLFKPGIFDLLPDVARHDFKEAGLCIAFERPTAAAFHILRATEDVLRIYYKKYMRPVKLNLTWGEIEKELRNKLKGKLPDKVLLDNLSNIRNSFRNPTAHPDKIYDIQEAQDLFNQCIDVVNRMAEKLGKKPSTVEETF